VYSCNGVACGNPLVVSNLTLKTARKPDKKRRADRDLYFSVTAERVPDLNLMMKNAVMVKYKLINLP
jgi:hypothetical protein